MSLREDIMKVRIDLSELGREEDIHTTVEVSRSAYGKRHPSLGKHVKYSFFAKTVDDNGDLMAIIPLSYEIVIRQNKAGYRVSDSLKGPLYGSDHHQKDFTCALTLSGAEKKAKERARKALEIVCRHTRTQKASNSRNEGFVNL